MSYEEMPGYRAVSWEPLDVLSQETMTRLTSNIQAIHDYTPRAFWTSPNSFRDKSIKIASGRVLVPRQDKKNEITKKVVFSGFFSGGCKPNITTGINSRAMQNVYCTFSGDSGGLVPDNSGFVLHVQIAKEDGEKKKIARNIWIHWQAMGY